MGIAESLGQLELFEGDTDLYREIVRRFETYNRRHVDWGAQVFTIAQREDGRLVAGARGIVNLGLVEIRGVWVDPDRRGKGLGRRLIAAVEAEAIRRECTRAALDTYSWQAIDFYRSLGYEEYGRLDYPGGASRHFLVKDL